MSPAGDAGGGTPPHGTPPHGTPAVASSILATQRERATLPDGAPRGRVEAAAGRRRHRRHRRRLSRRGRLVAAGAVVVLLVLAGVLAWYEVEANPLGSRGKAVMVRVTSGEPLSGVVRTLVTEHVIGSGLAFDLWCVVHGAPVAHPGRYEVHQHISFATLSAVLNAGPNVYEVVVDPGTTIAEVATQLGSLPGNLARSFAQEAKTGAVRSPFQASPGTTLEGLIGAGAYRLVPGETARTLLSKMVARFDAEAEAAGLSPSTTVGGLSAYQIVTLASISQKEGYFTRYMGDVARVIYNRLAAGMRLDMTSTVLYSLGKDGGSVTAAEEQLTTPYNTYLHAGLTPTPICTPSLAALRAATSPPPGAWLYFELVTAKKGVMVFSATYTRQLAAEQEAAKNAPRSSSSGSQAPAG